jgi:hypothetical protein
MIDELIQNLENYKFKFITIKFETDILKYLKLLLPVLNSYDMNILFKLTLVLIEEISIRYNFKKDGYNIGSFNQWTKNNGRDIVSLALTLIPYIGNADDSNYNNIQNLRDIIFKSENKTINTDILELERKTALNKYFPFSNFTLGLLNKKDDVIFDLYEKNQHTIYHCIENNFVSMMETIKITNGKLFVNWINIIPTHNYKASYIYQTSIKEINKMSTIINNTISQDAYNDFFKILKENKGLWVGDYYNVYTNGYFLSIKKIKWVIFCKKIESPNNNKYYYMIQYLNKILNLSTIFKYTDYNNLPDVDKNKFENEYKLFYNNLKNNIVSHVDLQFEFNIVKNIISFMCFNYSKGYLLDSSIFDIFNEINVIDSLLDIDPVYTQIDKISNQKLIDSMGKISAGFIWDYLKESIVILQTTPYAKYLIQTNKQNELEINMNFFNLIETDDAKINLKNLYNISKALCHDVIDKEYILLGNNFKSLNEFYIFRFFGILLHENVISNLNINKNIRLQEVNNYNYNEIMDKMQKAWDIIKLNLVWDYLNDNGLLSTFNINLELTDNNLMQTSDVNLKNKKIQSGLKKFFDKNKQLFDCNYFLTNEPYKNLNNYMKSITESLINYTFYANDWISQLNFFNHYINKSVMYVTGSTGTGKSTQVPKLVMYALKMYDYKNNGKVICTQPRIPPTQDNAKRIAKEMGVDIVDNTIYKDKKEYKTDKYYVQYKHMKDNHTKKYSNHLTLKMVTDGTLLEELVNNPLLKKLSKFEYDDKTNNQHLVLDIENLYDVVMVDEAHEHNTNMDLILTLMRQTCMYNNSIRLIIVSATMDDDEPIYRSFYKLINDNIIHPIKQPIMRHPILNTNNYFIDSYYLDRRIHISIPKQSYSYKITEYYDEEIEKQFNIINSINNNYSACANAAQKKSYTIIKKICDTSIFGDILLFSTGKAEIKEAVRDLNKILPASVIALPFYSEMNSKYRDIISDINNKIMTVRNKKENISEEWGPDFLDIKDVPEGTYKRVVIIATNVAEASITIETLKYVVDTGYSKVNRYDVYIDSSNIDVEPISESSRIQRKGRIGRVSEGTVYYMYGKNKRLLVSPKYGITLGDFHNSFIKLSSQNQDSTKGFYWASQLNPYLYQTFFDNIKKIIITPELQNFYAYINNIYQIIFEQFFLLYKPVDNYYFYNFNELQGVVLPDYFNRIEDGYYSKELMDLEGNFYIIHPYENILERNIIGNIIMIDNERNNKMQKKIFNNMLENIKYKLLYVPVKIITEKKDEIIFYKRTEYYDRISEVMNIVKLEEKDSIILYICAGFNILFEGCQILAMLGTINDMSGIIKYENNNYYYTEIKNIFGSDSDITSIYKITSLLKKTFSDLLVYKVYNNLNVLEQFRGIYNNILKEYRRNNFTEIKESMDLMNWLYNNGFMDSDKGFLHWIKSSGTFKKLLLEDINKHSRQIENVCNSYYLNYIKVIEYYENLVYLVICVLSADIEYDKDFKKINPFLEAKKINSYLLKAVNSSIEDKLNYAFFLSQPLFISIMFNNGYKTLTTFDCSIKNFVKGNLNTLCNNISSYIGYYNIKNNKMSIIYNININNLSNNNPYYYNPTRIINTLIIKNNSRITIKQFNSNEWNRLIMIINNSFSNLSFNKFPLNNPNFPIIQEFSKQFKYIELETIND